MEEKSFTPFFVADRQASLRILSGLRIPQGKNMGIMTHANTSEPFKLAISQFPCFDIENCVISGGKCRFDGMLSRCRIGRELKEKTCIVCDSGVFQKHGSKSLTYEELFEEYEKMGAHYGIIMDVLKNRSKTIDTAREAINIYETAKRSFKLIGVAQGKTAKEYLECYKELQNLGYEHIAIGGMLKRRRNSARYVNVRKESILNRVLRNIRKYDPDGWIFTLGCYSPGRHSIFLENSIFGADYKGWIFNYNGHSPKRGNRRSSESRYRQVRSFIEDEIISKPQKWRSDHRLLIIPCSKAKRVFRGPAQAISMYDGPLYRMLRNRIYDFSNNDGIDIVIISAKYGAIKPKTEIINYNQRMTNERAIQLQPEIKRELSKLISKKDYSDVLIDLGGSYLTAIGPTLCRFPEEATIRILQSRIGDRLKETKEWLYS